MAEENNQQGGQVPNPPGAPNLAPATPAQPTVPAIGPTGFATKSIVPMICPQCHQPVPDGAYFCPNCGFKLSASGPAEILSTSVLSQILLYAFSIVLPVIAYLAITKWQGIKYVRSEDPKAQQMGWIAIALLTISSVITIWLTTQWINSFVQSATSTAGLSSYGL